LPPLTAGQFQLGQAPMQAPGKTDQQPSMVVPVAVALWARVSPEIDTALSTTLDKQVRLQANQWVSGDNIWLMAAAGDPRVVPDFIERLREREFKGKEVKWRAREADGQVVIRTLGQPR